MRGAWLLNFVTFIMFCSIAISFYSFLSLNKILVPVESFIYKIKFSPSRIIHLEKIIWKISLLKFKIQLLPSCRIPIVICEVIISLLEVMTSSFILMNFENNLNDSLRISERVCLIASNWIDENLIYNDYTESFIEPPL